MARSSGFAFRAEVKGLQEIIGKLKQADEKIARKAVRTGTRAASGLLLRAAKSHARSSRKSGLLIRSLGRKFKSYPKGGKTIVVVGPRTGFKQMVVREGREILANPTRYAHLVELGTSRSQAKPFLEPALREQEQAMISAIRDAIVSALQELGVA